MVEGIASYTTDAQVKCPVPNTLVQAIKWHKWHPNFRDRV